MKLKNLAKYIVHYMLDESLTLEQHQRVMDKGAFIFNYLSRNEMINFTRYLRDLAWKYNRNCVGERDKHFCIMSYISDLLLSMADY